MQQDFIETDKMILNFVYGYAKNLDELKQFWNKVIG